MPQLKLNPVSTSVELMYALTDVSGKSACVISWDNDGNADMHLPVKNVGELKSVLKSIKILASRVEESVNDIDDEATIEPVKE